MASLQILPKTFFPRIHRFITEYWKICFISFISGVVLLSILVESLALIHTMQAAETLKQERITITQEINHLQKIVNQYAGYRDAYVRLAALEYQIGNREAAKVSVQKALELDPNFASTRVLGAKIKKGN